MFKKLLFSILSLTIIFNTYNAYAFLDKVINSTSSQNVVYENLTVVSDNDFNDTIYVSATSSPNTALTFYADWNDDQLQKQSIANYTTDSAGKVAEFQVNHKWNSSTNFGNYYVEFTATTPEGLSSQVGSYRAYVSYAIISLTNDKGVSNNGTIKNNVPQPTFTCTNSTYMAYYPNADTTTNSNVGTQSGYTFTYLAPNDLGKHKIECGNIGGANTIKSFTYTVTDNTNTNCPPGQVYKNGCRDTFDITAISSTPNKTNTANTFTWNSTADTCNVYTNDKATRLNPSASSKSGNNFSAVVPAANMPNNVGSYNYYIKCYSASLYTSSNLEADTTDPDHTGWKVYNVNITSDSNNNCPTPGHIKDSNGYCHAPCATGYTWNESSRQCIADSGNTFNINSISSTPNKTNTANTFTWYSDANNTCALYEYGNGYLYYTGGPVKIVDASRSGNNWTANMPANKSPSSAGNVSYYIGCYSDSRLAGESNGMIRDLYNGYKGWKAYSVSYSSSIPTCSPTQVYRNGDCRDTFDITNISSTPNKTNTNNTFTWNSTADTCNVYTNDKATRLNPSASSKSGNNFSAVVPAANMPSNEGSYNYYIKCYSASLYTSSNLEADNTDPDHTGWKSYNISIVYGNCPINGDIRDSNGYCHTPCNTGYVWNESSRQCDIDNQNTFNIKNVISSPNEASKDTTFSWWSDAGGNYCYVYNYNKSEMLGYAVYGSTNWSVTIPANKMPSAPGTYGYYINCFDRYKHPNSSLEETNDNTQSPPYNYGWKQYSVYLSQMTCSQGQVYENGSCVTDTSCPTGQVYENGSCVTDTSCPTGQVYENGACITKNYFDINTITINPKEANKDNIFTWTSAANICDVYSYAWDTNGGHPVSKLNTSASSKNGNNFSATVSAANMPTEAGNYGYYVKCESTDTNLEANQSLRKSWENNPLIGWKYFTVSITQNMGSCPTGEVRSTPTGSCHIPCQSGYTWNEAAETCGNPNPSCNWADPATKTSAICSIPYFCKNGNTPELRIYYKDGHYDVINPPTDPFTWDINQYQYQFYCDSTHLTPVAPLRKTYTHFSVFNISASNVQKGTGINLNWSVEDPNITCKIEGFSIKNPNQIVFNSKSDNRIDMKISTSTGGIQTSTRNMISGDYKTIIGSYWNINQSTRFIASCTDTGTYKPGYYQLIRDIYVIGEEER